MKIRFDADRFKKSFVKRQAGRQISAFFYALGEDNVRRIVGQNKDITTLISQEKLSQYRGQARNYKWAAELLSDEDVISLIPEPFVKIVKEHPEWLKRQLETIRQIFG